MSKHQHNLENWQHTHNFDINTEKSERRTRYVLILTAITMVVEIIAGSIYGSMALLADGWHMATHVAAFAIAIFTYRYARKHADNPAFSFGTGKVNVLGGFASAMALLVVALIMFIESLQRLIDPHTIHFNEAIIVAVIGLLVNIASAIMLKHDHHGHDHGHSYSLDHAHDHIHHHDHSASKDHNLNAAYVHVLTDALTSLLAIAALLIGKYSGWVWLDPIMGIVGAIIITRWSISLIKSASPILLDANHNHEIEEKIRELIAIEPGDEVCDLHIWRVGPDHYAAIIAIVTKSDRSPADYKARLASYSKLSHVTVEVNICDGDRCLPVHQ